MLVQHSSDLDSTNMVFFSGHQGIIRGLSPTEFITSDVVTQVLFSKKQFPYEKYKGIYVPVLTKPLQLFNEIVENASKEEPDNPVLCISSRRRAIYQHCYSLSAYPLDLEESNISFFDRYDFIDCSIDKFDFIRYLGIDIDLLKTI